MKKEILVCSECGQAECYQDEIMCSGNEDSYAVVKWVKTGDLKTKVKIYTIGREAIGVSIRRGSLWQG